MVEVHVIKNIFPGVSLGRDSDLNTYYITNGDLYLDDDCEIEISGKTCTLKELSYEISFFTKELGDKDGLINTANLKEIKLSKPFDRIFQIKDKWCFPSYSIKKLIEIVISNDLWPATRISISKTRYKTIARATVYGINFKQALLKAARTGISTTHLYCSDFKKWSHLGVFADFLIKITRNKERLLEFNGWQAIGSEETLFFVHGIIDEDFSCFTHIDFAFHHTSLDEIQKLLSNGKDKPELTFKEKILRLDGQIKVDIGFELMSSFFPIDNLVDEYYHCLLFN